MVTQLVNGQLGLQFRAVSPPQGLLMPNPLHFAARQDERVGDTQQCGFLDGCARPTSVFPVAVNQGPIYIRCLVRPGRALQG